MKKKSASKKMMMRDDCPVCGKNACSCTPEPHPYGRGKALMSVAIGLLLILFGFRHMDLYTLAMLAGLLYMIKGTLRLMGNW